MHYFSSFSQTQGLGSVFITEYFELMTELAVSTNRLPVMVPDLFTIRAGVIQGVTVRDTNVPVATVLEPVVLPPPAMPRTTNATFLFAGTAQDNDEILRVLIDKLVNNQLEKRILAGGQTNWELEVPLTPGTNTFLVRSLDQFGNLSTGQVRQVFYSVPRPVTLQVEGKGKTIGITNGQIMEVGVTYPLTATPAKGYYFLNWRGSVLDSRARTVYFTMEEGAVVICRYSRNLLGLSPGKYDGVFVPATNDVRASVGLVSLT